MAELKNKAVNLEVLKEAYKDLDTKKANKTDISVPYKFRGNCTFASLPTSGNEINDTFYVTDEKCKYSWNGTNWYQSSLSEADYLDELNAFKEEVNNEVVELNTEIGNLVSKNQGTENSGKALIVDENGNVICGEAGVSADATLSEEGKAADAAATGKAVAELKSDMENLDITRDSNDTSDFDISDENGNVLARFENGHFKTKKFDSEKSPTSVESDEDSDLDISDENGNIIVRLSRGHVKTKNFDSEYANKTNTYVQSSNNNTDLDIADAQGNVLASFYNGHFRTKNFDSAEADTELGSKIYGKIWKKNFKYIYGISSNITMDVNCKKGDRLVFHLADGVEKWDYGNVVSYYANGKLLTGTARGNGYFQHKATEDIYSVGVVIDGTSYSADTDMIFELTNLGYVEIQPTIITVKQDGTGDFTSIREAVDSIVDANAVLNPYVIEVYEGTYNVLDDYTDEEIQHATDSAPYTFVGVKLTDGISMRGVGMRENVILHGELDTEVYESTIRGAISTINMQGNGGLENLTISAKNIRYCVHDDFRACTENHPYKRIVKNCEFIGEKVSNNPNTTYGAGMSDAGMDAIFEDCEFNGELLIHTQGSVKNSCTVIIRNCRGIRFRIGDNGYLKSHIFHIFGCEFSMIKYNNTTDGVQRITIDGTENEHAMIECDKGYIYSTGAVDKVPILGYDPGAVVCTKNYKYEKTSNADIVSGIVIGEDDRYTYVQRKGYINSNIIGIDGLSVGDYISISNSAVSTGGTKDDAIGIVTYVNPNNVAFIKLLF